MDSLYFSATYMRIQSPSLFLKAARERLGLQPQKKFIYSSKQPELPKRYRRLDTLRVPLLIRMAKKSFIATEFAFIPEHLKQFLLRPTPLCRILNPLKKPYQRKSSPLREVSYPCTIEFDVEPVPPPIHPRPHLNTTKTTVSFRPTLLTRTTSSPSLPRQVQKAQRILLNTHPLKTKANTLRLKGRVTFLLGRTGSDFIENPVVVDIFNNTREEDSEILCR